MSRIKNAKSAPLSRRQFLVASAGASVMLAFAPALSAGSSESASERLTNKRFNPTIWFEIDQSGAILVNVTRAEMGQHVGTALARIVAEELGADWDRVSFNHVDTDPKWGYMVTGGSWSVFQSYVPMSQAGAAGRAALIEAAAELLGVAAKDCGTENSQVICGSLRLDFADIVKRGKIDKTYSEDQLAKFSPKKPLNRQLIAKPSKALDIPVKTTGEARYGIDVELDGMLYARPLIPPTRYGSKVLNVDDSGAKEVEGYLGYKVLNDPSEILHGWVSVLADSYYGAIKAADAIKVKYRAGETVNVSEEDLIAEGGWLVCRSWRYRRGGAACEKIH